MKLLNTPTIRNAQDCKCTLIFKQISRPIDDYNNQDSPQQGVGKFDNEYMHVVRHAQAVAIIKSV